MTTCVTRGASKPVVSTSQLQRTRSSARLNRSITSRRVAALVDPLTTARRAGIGAERVGWLDEVPEDLTQLSGASLGIVTRILQPKWRRREADDGNLLPTNDLDQNPAVRRCGGPVGFIDHEKADAFAEIG